MQQQELVELMQAAAADAVNYSAEQFEHQLDFSLNSLALVDDILSKLHQQQLSNAFSTEILFTLSNIFGAYLGQIFIQQVGGHWHNNQLEQAAPYVAVQLADKEFPFASVCYHKLSQDNSISVQQYLQQAKANAMQ